MESIQSGQFCKHIPRKKNVATHRERVKKDVECAFGILVQRFHILQRPLRGWFAEDLKELVQCCVILHNMTVEARFGSVDGLIDEEEISNNNGLTLFGRRQITVEEADDEGLDLFAARVGAFATAMQSSYEHFLLKEDLVEHINATRD